MIQLLRIEVIRPNLLRLTDDNPDEGWIHRTTVRTFKVSGEVYADIERQADELLGAYLEAHPGTVGSWTLTSWDPYR